MRACLARGEQLAGVPGEAGKPNPKDAFGERPNQPFEERRGVAWPASAAWITGSLIITFARG